LVSFGGEGDGVDKGSRQIGFAVDGGARLRHHAGKAGSEVIHFRAVESSKEKKNSESRDRGEEDIINRDY
jgi:hypothetical protein